MKLKTLFFMAAIALIATPVLAAEDAYFLEHKDLIPRSIRLLIDEEMLPKKEAVCVVVGLEKAMGENAFDEIFRLALYEENPTYILDGITYGYHLPTAKKKRIYQEVYDYCMKQNYTEESKK